MCIIIMSLERHDWQNIMAVLKRGIYENNFDHLTDASLDIIQKNDNEAMSLNKLYTQYGGNGAVNRLNVVMNRYFEMKGGVNRNKREKYHTFKASSHEPITKISKTHNDGVSLCDKYGQHGGSNDIQHSPNSPNMPMPDTLDYDDGADLDEYLDTL